MKRVSFLTVQVCVCVCYCSSPDSTCLGGCVSTCNIYSDCHILSVKRFLLLSLIVPRFCVLFSYVFALELQRKR